MMSPEPRKKKKTLSMEQMARIALKDMLPKHEDPDPRSTELKDLLKRIPQIPLQKLEKWKDEVFDLGRKEGFDDMVIGKWIRKSMAEADYSQRRIEQILPDTAKQSYSSYHNTESTNISDYQEPVTENTTTQEIPVIEQQEQETEPEDEAPTGYYQMPVEDFKIEDIEQYDRLFLIKVVQYLYTQIEGVKRK